MKKQRRSGILAISVVFLICMTIVVGHALGFRLNFTDSAPHGLWFVSSIYNANSIKRGALIEVCPPFIPIVRLMSERGYLSSGNCADTKVISLLKPVSAVAGDVVHIHKGQLATVNGVSLPNTAAMLAIPAWPDGFYKVPNGQIWVFSSYSAGSFDSRYFGPVEIHKVRGKASPVVVGGDVNAITKGVAKQ